MISNNARHIKLVTLTHGFERNVVTTNAKSCIYTNFYSIRWRRWRRNRCQTHWIRSALNRFNCLPVYPFSRTEYTQAAAYAWMLWYAAYINNNNNQNKQKNQNYCELHAQRRRGVRWKIKIQCKNYSCERIRCGVVEVRRRWNEEKNYSKAASKLRNDFYFSFNINALLYVWYTIFDGMILLVVNCVYDQTNSAFSFVHMWLTSNKTFANVWPMWGNGNGIWSRISQFRWRY